MRCPRCGYDVKRPFAVETGRQGGHARKANMTPEQRKASATTAAAHRWAGHVKKEKPRK